MSIEIPMLPPLASGAIPSWLAERVEHLIRQAEVVIPGPKLGLARKRWVQGAVRGMLRELRELVEHHDIPQVPDWIETPAEAVILDVLTEAVFALLPERRKPKQAAQLIPGIQWPTVRPTVIYSGGGGAGSASGG